MSEREIRRILERVRRELDASVRHVSRKIVLPAAIGATLALSGCETDEPTAAYMVPAMDVDLWVPPDTGPDPGPDIPPMPAYGVEADFGPQPDYMAPDAGIDPGMQPDYMAPDVLPLDVAVYGVVDIGPQPDYMAPDAQ